MGRKNRRTIAIAAVGVVAVVGGGAAIAATKLTGPKAESQAIVNDAAKRLGVQPDKLSQALEDAYAARIDQAVKDGRLTTEQGNALKKAAADGNLPLVGGPGLAGPRGFGGRGDHHGFGVGGGAVKAGLDAAASYLGLTEDALRQKLESGQSLADVAKATEGKTVAGLKDALTTAATKQLDDAVTAGRITKDQAAAIEKGLSGVLDRVIQGTRPERGFDHRGGPGLRVFGSAAAADYLGLSESALRQKLESGQSLADVAKAQGKTVAGLEQALTAAVTKKIDAAVTAGRLTKAQAAELKQHVSEMVDHVVEDTPGDHGRFFRFRGGAGAPAPPAPPAWTPASDPAVA